MTTPIITTTEAMKLLRVKSYDKFNAIRKKYGIKPVWRGGDGNVYLADDFNFTKKIDNQDDPFYDHVHG